MTYDWDNARAIALGQIEKYGAVSTVVKKGSTGGYDNSGNVIPDVPDVVVDGIITSLAEYKPHEIDGTKIKVGDAWAYFHSDDTAEIGMQTTVNGVTFRVISVPQLVSPEGVVVWVKLQLRV